VGGGGVVVVLVGGGGGVQLQTKTALLAELAAGQRVGMDRVKEVCHKAHRGKGCFGDEVTGYATDP